MSREEKKPVVEKKLLPEELVGMLNKAMPFDDDAERGVLSCLLQNPENRITEVRRMLAPEAFYHSMNRLVFVALMDMDAEMPRPAIDPVTLSAHLRAKDKLDMVGGPAGISELYGFVPIPSHFPYYVTIVRELFIQRQLCGVGLEIAHAAQTFGRNEEDGVGGIVGLVTRAEALTFGVLESARGTSENNTVPKHASVGVAEWIEHNERVIANEGKILGLATGILEFDSTFHGIDNQEGELVVIAGRPGQGKTAMACSIANHLAVVCGRPGLIFSIEMSGNQFYTRMILGMAGVDTSKAMTGHYSTMDHELMVPQVKKLQRAPLYVCDNAAINEMELLAQIQFYVRVHGIEWIMVDHLHKVRHSNPKIQADERQRLVNVMEVLRYAKKQHHLGAFVMVQLSRETDRNKGAAPTLADLSGSGAIEQDTEKVVVLHRPAYYTPWHKLHPDKQEAWSELVAPRRARNAYQWSDGRKYEEEDGGWARQDYEEDAVAFILKNRSGPTPEVHIRYEQEFTRFSSRMPKLTSNNALDHQIGTYRADGGKKKEPKTEQAGEYARPDYSKGKTGGGQRRQWDGKDFVEPGAEGKKLDL